MTLKEFREITKDFDEDVVLVFTHTDYLNDKDPITLELEFKGYDIGMQYYDSIGELKRSKVIILE